jgi:cytochrome c biogenesis protein CcdA
LFWLGIGAVYVLVLGIPLALLGLLIALIVRAVRRRREDALLSRT